MKEIIYDLLCVGKSHKTFTINPEVSSRLLPPWSLNPEVNSVLLDTLSLNPESLNINRHLSHQPMGIFTINRLHPPRPAHLKSSAHTLRMKPKQYKKWPMSCLYFIKHSVLHRSILKYLVIF